MGYSHQFHRRKAIPKAAWSRIVADFRALLAALPATGDPALHGDHPLVLVDAYGGAGTPVIEDDLIAFNGGAGEHGEDGCEDFWLERRIVFDHDYHREQYAKEGYVYTFCKTNRCPYDLVVCALLLVVNRHTPKTTIVESDGGVADWMPSWRWARSVLGDGYDLPQDFYTNARSPISYWRVEMAKASSMRDEATRLRFAGYIDERERELAAYEAERDRPDPSMAPAIATHHDLSPVLGGVAC